MDCIVHGIPKSRTQPSNFHFPIHCATREAPDQNTFYNVAQKAQLFKCSCAHHLIPGFSLLRILGCPEHSALGSRASFSLSVETVFALLASVLGRSFIGESEGSRTEGWRESGLGQAPAPSLARGVILIGLASLRE